MITSKADKCKLTLVYAMLLLGMYHNKKNNLAVGNKTLLGQKSHTYIIKFIHMNVMFLMLL